jgi:hypothetical protein
LLILFLGDFFFVPEMICILIGQARLTATGLLRPWGKAKRLCSRATPPRGYFFFIFPLSLEESPQLAILPSLALPISIVEGHGQG